MRRRAGILIPKSHDTCHDLLPCNRLHVIVGNVEHIDIKVSNVQQSAEVEDILDRLPYEIEGEYPETEIPQPRHVPGALGNQNLGEFLASSDLAIIHTLREECQQNGDEGDISTKW